MINHVIDFPNTQLKILPCDRYFFIPEFAFARCLKCTLQECGDEEWNMKETSRFRLEWGRDGLIFTCYFDPNSPDKVVVERTKHSAMIHAVIWPVMTLLCGACLWIGLFLGCCTMKTKGPDGETTTRTSRRRQYGLLHSHVTLPE